MAFVYLWASQVVLVVKNRPANVGDVRDSGFDPSMGKIPCRRAQQPIPVLLSGESQRQRSLVATVHRAAKSQTGLK